METHILHVDDDPDILALVRMTLELTDGISVRSCVSGQEALELAALYTPDLLLLDVMMPDMSGPQTLKAIRKLPGFANVPAVFMTASIFPPELEKLWKMDPVDVIAKPFDPMSLAKQVDAALMRTPQRSTLTRTGLRSNARRGSVCLRSYC